MNTKYGCALLAGGAGSRMGSANKAILRYKGRTFLENISRELTKTEMPCYLSVANYEQDTPEGWKLVHDAVTDEDGGYTGPIGGVYSCLKQACEDGLEGLFFIPCDAPYYEISLAGKLLPYINDKTDAVICRTSDGRLQTTFGWYSTRCIPAIEEDISQGKYKLLLTFDKVNTRIVDAEEADINESTFHNINDMEGYRKILDQK